MPIITRDSKGINPEGVIERAIWERQQWRSYKSKSEYDANSGTRYVMPLNGPYADVGFILPKEGAGLLEKDTYFADCDTYRDSRQTSEQTRYRFGNTGKRWTKELRKEHYRPYYKNVGGRLEEVSEQDAIDTVGDFPNVAYYAPLSDKQLSNLWDWARRRVSDWLPRAKTMYADDFHVDRYTDSDGELAKPSSLERQERNERVPETKQDIADELQRRGSDPHDPTYGLEQNSNGSLTIDRDRRLAGDYLGEGGDEKTVDYTQGERPTEDSSYSEEKEVEAVWEHLKETGDFDPNASKNDEGSPPSNEDKHD